MSEAPVTSPAPVPVPASPSQVAHPWRATARTVFAAIVTAAPVVPLVVVAVEDGHTGLLGPIGVGAIALSGAITRVMAIPAVNVWLARIGLSATPERGRHEAIEA